MGLGLGLAWLAVVLLAGVALFAFRVLVPAYRDGQEDALNTSDENNWHIGVGRLAYDFGFSVEYRRINAPKRRLKRVIDRRHPNDGKDMYR